MNKTRWTISLLLAVSLGFFYCGEKTKPQESQKEADTATAGDETPAADSQQQETPSEPQKTTSSTPEASKDEPATTTEPATEPTTEVAQAEPIDVKKVLRPCTPCHYLDKGADKIKSGLGPGLLGVYNRTPVIFKKPFPFAKWDAAALDKWLANPKAIKKGTKMTYKVSNADKRKKMIEALKILK